MTTVKQVHSGKRNSALEKQSLQSLDRCYGGIEYTSTNENKTLQPFIRDLSASLGPAMTY